MKQTLLSFASIVAIGYIITLVLLFVTQRSMIYFPTSKVPHQQPVLTVKHQGEQLRVIQINPGQQQAIVYFGGNAEAVAHNIAEFSQHFTKHTVYLVNYRGYGGSSGIPSEQALFADALAVYDEVASQHASIGAIGRSLGSGVASYLAAHRPVTKLALVTPFDSLQAVGQQVYPWLPVSLLLRDKYQSSKYVTDLGVPVLLVIAGDDRIIQPERSHSLAQAFQQTQPTVVTIKGAGHNSIGMFPQYLANLSAFFMVTE